MANYYGGSGNDSNAGSSGDDLSYGGAGNDSLSGGLGNDSLSGGSGNDLVDGGAGNDQIVGGRGNDTFYGGANNDEIIGDGQLYDATSYASGLIGLPTTLHVVNGSEAPITLCYIDLFGAKQPLTTIAAGQTYNYATLTSANFFLTDARGYFLDVIQGGNQTFTYSGPFADLLYGGDGEDSLLGQLGNDTLYGDAGNDTLYGGYGDDSLYGGLGNDSLLGDSGNDTIYGDGGNDSVTGADGSDLLFGGLGDDSLSGGNENDTIYGDGGNDSLSGDAGDDGLYGGAGVDTLLGGIGNDTLQGGAGNDVLSGGAGRDVFGFAGGGGADLVTDFDPTVTAGVTADQLDVSALQRADFAPVKVWDVTVQTDGAGNALLLFPGGESVVLQGVSPAVVQQPGMLHAMGVPCFVQGTRIATPLGPRPVEEIAAGDQVVTAGGLTQPVIWHGRQWVLAEALTERPGLRPVVLPARRGHAPLLLSPQHAVLIAALGGLARARHLAEFGLAKQAQWTGGVRYHHLLLPRHALICAEGQWCESFYPGPMALAMLDRAEVLQVRAAVLGQSPGLETGATPNLAKLYGPRCLPLLTRRHLRLWRAALGESEWPPWTQKRTDGSNFLFRKVKLAAV
jgi:Ca2+-binding RTX toxin-like protein